MRANDNGKAAAAAIEDALRRKGCDFTREVTLGQSAHGNRVRTDFLVHNIIEYPHGLAIEVKFQDRRGSIDQKFDYMVNTVRGGGYGRCPVLFIVYGAGFNAGALKWLRDQVDGHELIGVLSFEEFLSWLQRRINVRVTAPTFQWKG